MTQAPVSPDWIDALGWAFAAASLIGCLYLLFAARCVARFAARAAPATANPPPATILKPLCGAEPGLADNLATFFRQDHPAFQIVMGLQDPDDPAVTVATQVQARFPAVPSQLVVVDERGCPRPVANPKVANLLNMMPQAAHDVLVLADADMRVRPDYLATVTAPLADPAVGLVTCLYRGQATGSFWSRLGACHINHGFLPQALVGDALGQGAGCFGATIALTRQTLEAIGGFAAIADDLADDHALGQAVVRLGRSIHLSARLVDTTVSENSLAALFAHELRWARTVLLTAPLGYAASVITHPVALATLALTTGLAQAPAVLAVALVCRLGTAWRNQRALGLPQAPLWLLPARDLLSFAVFVSSFAARTVQWRQAVLRVDRHRLIVDRARNR